MNPPRIAPRPPGPREAKLLMEAADALRRGDTRTAELKLRAYCAQAPSDPAGRHAARVSASLLNAVGLSDLVAGNSDEYVEIAVRLATDHDMLARLRSGMRARLLGSPLMDARAMALVLEHAYREAVRAQSSSQ